MSKFILSNTQPFILYVNSKNRNNPSTTNSSLFNLPLAFPPLHVSRITLLNAIIPNTFYAFRDDTIKTNNYFDFVDSLGNNQIQIPVGTYNSTQLVTELQTLLNAASTDTYTVSYDTINLRLNITSSFAGFQILGLTGANASQNCLSLLGFNNVDTTPGASQTAPNAINIQGPKEIFIKCSQFQAPIHDTRNSFVALFQVSLTAPYGSINFYEQFQGHETGINVETRSLNSIDIEIVDENGKLLFLNTDWSCLLRFD